MGLASAVSLAERGTRVAVLDRGPLAREASARNAGGVRQSNRDPRELPLAREAARLWPLLDERLGLPTGYRRTGNLRIALDESERAALRAAVALQRQGGLEIEWLEARQARELVPALSAAVLGATWCPTDGQAEPEQTMDAWLFAARRLGVTLLPGRGVVGIEVAGTELRISPVTHASAPVVLGEDLRDLGAAIAARLVSRLGGSLAVDSETLVVRLA